MRIYYDLPYDIQNIVKSFFHVWERKGLTEPILKIQKYSSYYDKIRTVIRGIKYNPQYKRQFIYRQQKHFFKWHLFYRYSSNSKIDFWVIEIHPSWKYNETCKIYIKYLLKKLSSFNNFILPFYVLHHIFATDTDCSRLLFNITVIRDELMIPTRQTCLDDLCKLMKNLAIETHTKLNILKI